jgi:glycosyltransferase involved in cell wall biosynthesis
MREVKEPLVSIVIPYYNKKDTIKRSVQSILNQTYTNWELILVDDKGVEPLEWNEEWNSLPIEVLTNPINLGAAQSRQRGQEVARGKYIAFLDADDWWEDTFLELCVEVLRKNEDVAGCYGRVFEVKNNKLHQRSNNEGLTNILETIISHRRPWQTSSILWRKIFIGNWGKLKSHEDSWFELKTSQKNNRLMYLANVNVFCSKEESIEHLSLYHGKGNVAVDQQELFMMVFNEFWSILNVKYRIILINRLIRGQIKINQYAHERADQMAFKLYNLDPRLFWFSRYKNVLILLHETLQLSYFKINL